jgi:hypothetical protein
VAGRRTSERELRAATELVGTSGSLFTCHVSPIRPKPQHPQSTFLTMKSSKEAACCWTCKIRHVKCDASQAACLQCTSRQIDCHGYGPKPLWMDGSAEEERERELIKRAVKENFKQKKKLRHRLAKNEGHLRPRDRNLSTPRPALQDEQLSAAPQGKPKSYCLHVAIIRMIRDMCLLHNLWFFIQVPHHHQYWPDNLYRVAFSPAPHF